MNARGLNGEDFIESLPDGLPTFLGSQDDRSMKLHGPSQTQSASWLKATQASVAVSRTNATVTGRLSEANWRGGPLQCIGE